MSKPKLSKPNFSPQETQQSLLRKQSHEGNKQSLGETKRNPSSYCPTGGNQTVFLKKPHRTLGKVTCVVQQRPNQTGHMTFIWKFSFISKFLHLYEKILKQLSGNQNSRSSGEASCAHLDLAHELHSYQWEKFPEYSQREETQDTNNVIYLSDNARGGGGETQLLWSYLQTVARVSVDGSSCPTPAVFAASAWVHQQSEKVHYSALGPPEPYYTRLAAASRICNIESVRPAAVTTQVHLQRAADTPANLIAFS